MMPLNKLLMMKMQYTPFTAVSGQMLGAAAIMACIPQTYHHSTYADLRRCLPLPPIFAVMLATSMLSLRFASIGAVTAIRNTAPLLALPLEHLCVEPQRITWQAVGALLCVVGGCVGYVAHDVHTTTLGVVLAVVNTIFSVADRLIQRHLLASVGISKCTLIFFNNLVGGLIVAALALTMHERVLRAVRAPIEAHAYWGLSMVAGLLLGYSGALAQAQVSATTHLMITNTNRVLSLVIASWALNEVPTQQSILSGIVLIVGTIAYAWR